MKKTLLDYFYIKSGNEIKLYSDIDASALIEMANCHIDRENGNALDYSLPELEKFIFEILGEYVSNGVSDFLLNKLNDNLKTVIIQCVVEKIEGKLSTIHIAHMPQNPCPSMFGAYFFSRVISLGGLKELKKCSYNSCLKFYTGRSNTKWCSKSCGSAYRVKKMRKNKKATC